MRSTEINLIGFHKLQVKLKKNMNLSAVKSAVKKSGSEMQKKAQKNAPVGTPQSTGIPGYVGGTLKRNIGLKITDGGMTAEVESTAEYAGYQEYGTRFMTGKPHIRPAFNEQKEKFKQDMRKLAR